MRISNSPGTTIEFDNVEREDDQMIPCKKKKEKMIGSVTSDVPKAAYPTQSSTPTLNDSAHAHNRNP